MESFRRQTRRLLCISSVVGQKEEKALEGEKRRLNVLSNHLLYYDDESRFNSTF